MEVVIRTSIQFAESEAPFAEGEVSSLRVK